MGARGTEDGPVAGGQSGGCGRGGGPSKGPGSPGEAFFLYHENDGKPSEDVKIIYPEMLKIYGKLHSCCRGSCVILHPVSPVACTVQCPPRDLTWCDARGQRCVFHHMCGFFGATTAFLVGVCPEEWNFHPGLASVMQPDFPRALGPVSPTSGV